jgi:hypothetical protein
MSNLRDFVQKQYLLHPHRRVPVGNYIITLASTSQGFALSLSDIFRATSNHCHILFRRVYDADHIFEDPDLLPKVVFGRSLIQIKTRTGTTDSSCVICDSPYTFSRNAPLPTSHSAMRTPCNHEFCYSCLQQWRRDAGNGCFRCPMCRLCLACGRRDCRLHQVTAEISQPFPFEPFFEAHFAGRTTEMPPFFGVGAPEIRRAREATRALRVQYACIHGKKEDISVSEMDKESAVRRLGSIEKVIDGTISHILERCQGSG